MNEFRDKVVLITGGSSGIGEATALRLARQGAKLALVARNQPGLDRVCREIKAIGAAAIPLPADVTVPQQVQNAVQRCVEHFGKLDIAVSSAGLSMRAMFESCTLEAMEMIVRVNFFGVLHLTHFALPHVIQAKGSLVAVSSITGKRGVPSYSVYGASKFAVRGLYEALAIEMRRHGVHVGVVSPAFVDTPLRNNVMGPDGNPWPIPPEPPFRVWPVEKVVERVVRLIAKRQRHALIPGFVAPLMVIDEMFGNRMGDRILANRFPIEKNDPPATTD